MSNIVNVINRLLLLDFNDNYEEDIIELIQEANNILESGRITSLEKNSLLSALKDFSSVTDDSEMVPMKNISIDELYRVYLDKKLNQIQLDFINKISDKKTRTVSCPTSFGKSFLIRLSIKSIYKKYSNFKIIVVVPTNALANEYHQKLNILSVPATNQPSSKSRVKVLTQEKAYLENVNSNTIVFIDEAYEMMSVSQDRNVLLSKLLEKYLKQTTLIKLISPNIRNPLSIIPEKLQDNFIPNTYVYTITSRTVNLENKNNLNNFIINNPRTIIYCGKRKSFELTHLLKGNNLDLKKIIPKTFKWIISEYGNNEYISLMGKGIIIHNGEVPKPIRVIQEALFKSKKANYLFATSTITQGVNLEAKNLVIYESIPRVPFNNFNFRNLIGRVGRYTVNNFSNRAGKVLVSNEIENIEKLIKVKDTILVDIIKDKSKSHSAKTAKNDELFGGTEKKKLIDYYIIKPENRKKFILYLKQNKNVFIGKQELNENDKKMIDVIKKLARYIIKSNKYIAKDIDRLIRKAKPIILWKKYLPYLKNNESQLHHSYKTYMFSGLKKKYWDELSIEERNLYKTKYISSISSQKEATKAILNKIFNIIHAEYPEIKIEVKEEKGFEGLSSDFSDTTILEHPEAIEEIKTLILEANK